MNYNQSAGADRRSEVLRATTAVLTSLALNFALTGNTEATPNAVIYPAISCTGTRPVAVEAGKKVDTTVANLAQDRTNPAGAPDEIREFLTTLYFYEIQQNASGIDVWQRTATIVGPQYCPDLPD